MRHTRAQTSLSSQITIDGDLDLLSTYQVKNLAAPASGEALRKGNKDIANAEVANAAAIGHGKLNLTGGIVMADLATAIKNAAAGIAVLNGSADVPVAQIPSLAASKITSGHLPVARLGLTDEKIAKGAGVSSDAEEIDVPADVPDAAAGDALETSADAENGQSATSYTKAKEIKLARGGTFRVKFDMKGQTTDCTVYARIYRNGVAVGTVQSMATTTYVTKSEDIAGWTRGDLLQLYQKGCNPSNCLCKNLRLYTLNPIAESYANYVATD